MASWWQRVGISMPFRRAHHRRLHPGRRDRGPGHRLFADPSAGHAADVPELLPRVRVQRPGPGGYALFLGVTRWAVFNIPMLFLLDRLVGMYGVVWAQSAADLLTVALSLAVYHRFARRHFPRQIQAA